MRTNKKKRGNIVLIASLLLFLPIVLGEGITLKNLGVLGFNDTNQEYTSIRTVLLELNYSLSTPTGCRYKNNASAWTPFETCVPEKYWMLSTGQGLKNVSYQINDSGTIKNFSDTIYYNYTGAGLDTTPPSTVVIDDGDYSNSNNSINISWSAAADPESDILGIPLLYIYRVSLNSVPNSTWISIGTQRNFSYSINLSHNDNVSVEVNVTNSADLQSSTMSDGLIIDLVLPNNTKTNSTMDQTNWYSNNSVFFNWSSWDNLSGIGGFSYTFSTDTSITPDNLQEGPAGQTNTHKNKTFSISKTGIYRFRIKAMDKAENWGNVTSRSVRIDQTPPSKPVMTLSKKVFASLTINFSWTQSYDDDSGINYYFIEIWNTSEFNISSDYFRNYTISNTTLYYELDTSEYDPLQNYTTYYARVKVYDNVLNPSVWSNEEAKYDWTPPVITIIRPNTLIESGIYPSIALTTDEQALCYYDNSTGSQTLFEYTNQTYHETKPGDSQTQYNITCNDLVGNSQTDTTGAFGTNGAAVSAISVQNTPSGYSEQIISLSVNITAPAAKGEVQKSRFNVQLDGTNKDFTVYDNGAGKYTISLTAPSTGNYALNISVDAANDPETLTINPLNLIATYQDTFPSTTETNRITFFNTSNYTSGFASDANNVSFGSASSILNITSGYDGKIYFFATKKLQRQEEKDKRLKQKTFITEKRPSFGYPASTYFLLKNSLGYAGIDIDGNETLQTGSHNLLVKRLKSTAKKKVLVTSKITKYNDEGVIQYG